MMKGQLLENALVSILGTEMWLSPVYHVVFLNWNLICTFTPQIYYEVGHSRVVITEMATFKQEISDTLKNKTKKNFYASEEEATVFYSWTRSLFSCVDLFKINMSFTSEYEKSH